MALDLVTIGFAADTRDLERANRVLQQTEHNAQLAAAAALQGADADRKWAEAQRRKAEEGERGTKVSERKRTAEEKLMDSINKQVQAIEKQAAVYGMSTREAKLYELATKGASNAQLKAADAAMKHVESMDRARDMGHRMGAGIKAGAELAVKAVVAIAAAVASAVVAMELIISKVADYQDMSEKSGADPAGLASLRTAADVGGIGIAQLNRILIQMEGQLSRTNDESKGAGKALKQIGIDIDWFRTLKPDEKFKVLSDRLAEFEDNGNKAGIRMAIMGRGAAEAAPAMVAWAEQIDRANKHTNESIKLADQHNDRMKATRSEFMQSVEVLTVGVLPVYTALINTFMSVITQQSGIGESASKLSKSTAIQDWAAKIGHAVATFLDWGASLLEFLSIVKTRLDAFDDRIDFSQSLIELVSQPLSQANIDKVKAAYAKIGKTQEEEEVKLLARQQNTGTKYRDEFARQMAGLSAGAGTKPDGTPKLPLAPFTTGGGDATGKRAAREAEAAANAAISGEIEALKRGLAVKAELTRQHVALITHQHRTGSFSEIEFINQVAEAEKAQLTRGIANAEAILKLAGGKTKNVKELAALEGAVAQAKAAYDGRELKRAQDITEVEYIQRMKAMKAVNDLRIEHEQDKANAFVASSKQFETEALALSEQQEMMRNNNEMLRAEFGLLGETDKVRAIALGHLRIEVELRKKIWDIEHSLVLSPEGKGYLIAGENALAESAKGLVTMNAELAEQAQLFGQLEGVAKTAFTDVLTRNKNMWKNMRESAKSMFFDWLYNAFAKKMVLNVIGSFTGSGGGGSSVLGVAGAISGAGVGGSAGGTTAGGLISNASTLGSIYNAGAGVYAAGMAGYAGSAGAAAGLASGGAATFGTVGASTAGTTVIAGGAGGVGAAASAALAAIPVWGWIALAGIALWAAFGGKGGGPKSEGGFTPAGLNLAGPSIVGASEAVRGDTKTAKGISESISGSYEKLASELGIVNKKLDVGIFYAIDNAKGGDALTQLQVTSSAGYNRAARTGGVENVARGDEEFQKALAEETFRVIFGGLSQAKELGQEFRDVLLAIGTDGSIPDMEAAMTRVTNARKQQMSLEETLFQLTHTDGEKLIRLREQERAAIDPLNLSLLNQIYVQQDLIAAREAEALAVEETARAMQEAANTARELYENLQEVNRELAEATDTHLKNYIVGLKDQASALDQVSRTSRSAADSLRSYLRQLSIGPQAGLSSSDQYSATKTLFGQTARLAAGGDVKAISDLQSAGEAFLAASREYNASSGAYFIDLAAVKGAVEGTAISQTQVADIADLQLAALNLVIGRLDTVDADINKGTVAMERNLQLLLVALKAQIVSGGAPTFGAISAATTGPGGQTDITKVEELLRSVNWTPANSGLATAQTAKIMQNAGWSSGQVGQALGFTSGQIEGHLANYGFTSNGSVFSIEKFLRSLDWGDAANASRQTYEAAKLYGWTSSQVGSPLGFTGQQINEHMAKYGYPAFAAGTPFVSQTGPALMHQGERVFSKSENSDVTANMSKMVQELKEAKATNKMLMERLIALTAEIAQRGLEKQDTLIKNSAVSADAVRLRATEAEVK